MPKPIQKPNPPIIVGGRGDRTLEIAAKHADDYNQIAPLKEAVHNLERMKKACDLIGRDFSLMRRSVQIQINLTDDKSVVNETIAKGATLTTQKTDFYDNPEDQVRDSMLLGSPSEMVEKLNSWVEIGVNHFILMTPRPFDPKVMERFAKEVIPHFS